MIASGWRRKARPTTITAAAALRAAWRKSCPSGNLSNSFRSALPSTRTFAVVIGSPVNSGTASSSCAQATSRGCCSPSDGRQRGDASEPPFGEKSKLTCIRGALQWLPPVKGTVALFSPATRSRNAERAFHEPVCDLLPRTISDSSIFKHAAKLRLERFTPVHKNQGFRFQSVHTRNGTLPGHRSSLL